MCIWDEQCTLLTYSTRHPGGARAANWEGSRDTELCCRVSAESSKEDGYEASSADPGSLQRQLDRAREKLAARDASAKKYKVYSRCP